jgi:putative phage-type endonuclease
MTVTDTAPVTGRRVTPAARLVLPSTASREQWLLARRGGMGSSDIPPALELTEYGTPSHVYYDKIGELPEREDAGEYAFWGNQHEDTVARVWAQRNRSAIRRVGLVANVAHPHRMCTLDRRVTVCPLRRDTVETCALEIKTRSAFLAGKWERHIPDDVLAQVLWQMAVTGYDHIHVAVLIGGNDYRQTVVRRAEHEQLIDDILTIADRLWFEHVIAHRPPPPSGNPEALVDLFDELHPERTGVAHLDRDLAAFEALQEYMEASLVEKAAADRKKAAKAVLVNALGDNDTAALGEDIAFTYKKTAGRESVNTARLAEQFPEAFDACVSTGDGSPRFDISRKFRKNWRSSE